MVYNGKLKSIRYEIDWEEIAQAHRDYYNCPADHEKDVTTTVYTSVDNTMFKKEFDGIACSECKHNILMDDFYSEPPISDEEHMANMAKLHKKFCSLECKCPKNIE